MAACTVLRIETFLPVCQYTWDNDQDVHADKYDFNELSARQQAAARTLGHTAATWNSDSDY